MISGLKKPSNPQPPTDGPPLLSNVLMVINPTSGTARKRKKLKGILEQLQAAAGRLEIIYTTCALDATRLVKEKKGFGYSLIICAGGDGTINEVINGLLDEDPSQDKAPLPIPPLAILPTGTGNGLAREIGLPLNPLSAYQAILTGTPHPVYAGKVTIPSPRSADDAGQKPRPAEPISGEEKSSQRYFILFVGAGFDGYVITRIDQRAGLFRRLPKLWIYFLFGFNALFSYSFPTLHFSVDGVPHSGSTGLITKAKLVLGPLTIAPSADIGRPTLVLCLFKAKGMIGYIKTLFSFLLYGEAAKGIEYIEGREIEVLGASEVSGVPSCFVHADGESLGGAPAFLSISERPLFLIHPSP
jgi:diacylglycerol kinase (ATP)